MLVNFTISRTARDVRVDFSHSAIHYIVTATDLISIHTFAYLESIVAHVVEPEFV